MATPTYSLIASNTLGSSAASVTFSSIPQTYTDLVLRMSSRGDSSGFVYDSIGLQINSDNSTNYSNIILYGTGSAAGSTLFSTRGAPLPFTYSTVGSTATTNTFGNAEIYFPNYTSTATKPFYLIGVGETNATAAYMSASAAQYRGSSGISNVVLTPTNSSNFVSGSSFYLYGIKNS